MKHYGDITKIDGSKVEPVWIVTGGSPCQDLSVAGKRAGLDGERSGLFMEQIRIIKEMRENDRRNGRTDELIRPRFMVWENVYGAFSSNKGEDFRVVLEETARVADKSAVIPQPPKGKWTPSGAILGDGWSIAWRVHDAQFWGVPQRRKRIALVADFGGESAPKILFEQESLSRNTEPSGETRESVTDIVETGVGTASGIGVDIYNQTITETEGRYNRCSLRRCNTSGGKVLTVAIEGNGSRPSHHGDGFVKSDVMYTLNGTEQHGVAVGIESEPILLESNQNHATVQTDGVSTALPASMGMGGGYVPMVSYRKQGHPQNAEQGQGWEETKVNDTLNAYDNSENRTPTIIKQDVVVRRLTPLECERLQGFPDGWTDIGDWTDSKGKKHKAADSPRYKALGNSIALPFWEWMAERMVDVLHQDGVENPTMASLFDGIGGFPLVYSRAGCEPIWASEIEEFPIAVTKMRFGEE